MCSMQCWEVKVMARHHNAEGKQRNNISKRLSRVEAQVKELTVGRQHLSDRMS